MKYTNILQQQILNNYPIKVITDEKLNENTFTDLKIGVLEFYRTYYDDRILDYLSYALDLDYDIQISITLRLDNNLLILENIKFLNEELDNNNYETNLKSAWLLEQMQLINGVVKTKTNKNKIPSELMSFYKKYGFAPVFINSTKK